MDKLHPPVISFTSGGACIDISSHRQDRSENPDRDIHPSAIDWSIELFLIDIISWSRFS
jgi:hypothetical protein